MRWHDELIDRLAAMPVWGYRQDGVGATEPTALAAVALALHKRPEARRALAWLVRRQQQCGVLGVTATEQTPQWPTGLALLAWIAADRETDPQRYEPNAQAAVEWLLGTRGDTAPRQPHVGHDTTLTGWPWVVGTHSWVEPTAINVLALKAAGKARHARTREAVRLLIDRQLPSGGCNYGNTVVLGQELRPHVQPTGLALLALADEPACEQIDAAVCYLERTIDHRTTTASLCWGALGLAAIPNTKFDVEAYLAAAYAKLSRAKPSGYALALLAIAIAAGRRPLTEWLTRPNPLPAGVA